MIEFLVLFSPAPPFKTKAKLIEKKSNKKKNHEIQLFPPK